MNVRSINAALLATASLGLALGVRLAAWPLVRVVVPPPARAAAVVSTAVSPLASDSLAHSIVARDPFRVTRRPSNVLYDPVRLAQPAVSKHLRGDYSHHAALRVENRHGRDGLLA